MPSVGREYAVDPYRVSTHVSHNLCPRQESNLHFEFRKLMFYPLNYEDDKNYTRMNFDNVLQKTPLIQSKTKMFHDELEKWLALLVFCYFGFEEYTKLFFLNF